MRWRKSSKVWMSAGLQHRLRDQLAERREHDSASASKADGPQQDAGQPRASDQEESRPAERPRPPRMLRPRPQRIDMRPPD